MAKKKNETVKWLFLLHILMLVYSFSGFFSKNAARQEFLSIKFFLCYGGMLMILVLYAFFWQQVIKHLPLTLAYANKAVTIVWGMIWGAVFFQEGYSIHKVIAAVIIMVGVVMYVTADQPEEEAEESVAGEPGKKHRGGAR